MPQFTRWPGREPTPQLYADHYDVADCYPPRWWPPGSNEHDGDLTAVGGTILDGTADLRVDFALFPNAKVPASSSDRLNPLEHIMTDGSRPMKQIVQKLLQNDAAYADLNRIACFVAQQRKRSEAGAWRRRLTKAERQTFDAHVDDRWPREPDRDRGRGSSGRGGGSSGRGGGSRALGRGRNGPTRHAYSYRRKNCMEFETSDDEGPFTRDLRCRDRGKANNQSGNGIGRRDRGKGGRPSR